MNKKLIVLVFAAVLAIGVVGCSSNSSGSTTASGSGSGSSASASSASTASASASSASAASESASAVSSASSSSVGMPNPWSEVASDAEAAQGAGLNNFTVPGTGIGLTVGKIGDWTFQCMDGIAQAKTTAGDTAITIRKGVYKGDDDISGDYNTYEYEYPLTLKGLTVNCAGHSDNTANKVIWVAHDNAYSILADGAGLTPDDINSLINALQ